MTSTETVDLELFVGKKVTFTLTEGDTTEQVEATIEAANDQAVMFKRKGKSNIEFKDASAVSDVALQESAEPVVKARRQDPVTIDNIKRHLVDRHGYAVADINAMSAVDAFEFHGKIDHEPLGHFHADKPAKSED